MGKVILIAKNILRRMFKKPANLLLHIVLPIIVSIGLFVAFNMGGGSTIAVSFADLSQTATSEWLKEQLSQVEGVNLYEADRDAIAQYVVNGVVQLGIVIPADFEDVLLSGADPKIEIVSINSNNTAGWLKRSVNYHIQNLAVVAKASGYDSAQYYHLMEQSQRGGIALKSAYVDDQAKAQKAALNTFGTYLIFLLISTFTIAFQIVDEKKRGTFSRIGMAPISKSSYTLANILVNLSIAMIQVGSVLLILKYVLGVEFYVSILIIYIILILFAICGISLGVMLASFSKDSTVAGVLLAAVLTPSCMIAGCLWPIEFMPAYMQKVAYMTPQRWVLDAISIIQRGGSFSSVFPNMLVVLCFTVLFFLISVYRFKNKAI